MAVTLTDQRTIINECDATTGWTGSATVTLFTTEPTGIESTGCLGMVVSNATQNAYFTVSSTDFTAGNSPGPSLIYVWIFHRAELDTTANGGLMIQLGDGTNRIGYHIAGADVDGFRHSSGPVGWQCIVLDTANRPAQFTVFAGAEASLNMAAITQIGIGFKTLVKAVGGVSNCFWDILRRGAIGQGLLITAGTSGDPGTWAQIAAADRGTGNQQAYGVVRELGTGVYGVQGPLTFGDTAGTTASYFKDTNVTVVFEDRAVGSDKYSITIQGNATGSTTWWHEDSSFVVPTTRASKFVATDADLQVMKAIRTSFTGFTQGFQLSADATNAPNHEFTGCTVRRCAQVEAGRVPISGGCLFTGHTGTDAALLWNANIDISESAFDNNTDGTNDPAGIEHPATGTFAYDALTFSGNDFDIYNSSGGLVTINATNGSNPSTTRNSVGSSTVINNAITLTLTGIQAGSEVRILEAGTTTERDGTEFSGTSFDFTYNFVADEFIDIVIHHLDYVYVRIVDFELPSVNSSIPIQQRADRNFSNPENVGDGILRQQTFRGRNDDGSESTATWIAVANENWIQEPDTNFRVRFRIQEINAVEELGFTARLQYNRNNLGWNNVTGSSSVVRASASTQFIDGTNTTRQIGDGTYISSNSGMDEGNGLAGESPAINFTGNDEVEVEFCVQIRLVDVSITDEIQLRVVRGVNDAVLDIYAQTPSLIVGPTALARYFINEAATGQSPTQVLDSMPNPVHLATTYVGDTPAYTSIAAGRGFNYPTGDVDTVGSFSVALSGGNKIFDAIDGAQKVTMEVVVNIPQDLIDGDFVDPINIFGIFQFDGNKDPLGLFWWGTELVADMDDGTNYFNHDYTTGITAGVHVITYSLDTTLATASDRIKVYFDGSLLTPTATNSPTQNATIDIPTGIAQKVSLGGWEDFVGEGGGYFGAIYYAAIYAKALSSAEASGHSTALAADNDSIPGR